MPAAPSALEAVPGLSQAISQDAQPTFPHFDDSFPATQVDSSTPPPKSEAPSPSPLERGLLDAFAAFENETGQAESEEEKLSKLGNLVMASGKALGIFQDLDEEPGPEAQVPSPNHGPEPGNQGCRVMVPPDFDYNAWHTNAYGDADLLEWPGGATLPARKTSSEPTTSPPKAILTSARPKPSTSKTSKPIPTPARAKPRPSKTPEKPVPSPIAVGEPMPNQFPDQPAPISTQSEPTPGQTAETFAVPTLIAQPAPSKIAEEPATPEKQISIPTLTRQPTPDSDKNPEEPIPIPTPTPSKTSEEPIPIANQTSAEPVPKISVDPVPVPPLAREPIPSKAPVPGPVPTQLSKPTPSKTPAPTEEGRPKARNSGPDSVPVPEPLAAHSPGQEPTEQVPGAQLKKMDGNDEDGDDDQWIDPRDIHMPSTPPERLSEKAADARLRRVFKPRKDGTFLVNKDFVQMYHDIHGGGRDKMLNLFEKAGYCPAGGA